MMSTPKTWRGTYTVEIRNAALGTSLFRGTFDDEVTATAYAEVEALRSRKFATYVVWTGTPKTPVMPTSAVFQGKK